MLDAAGADVLVYGLTHKPYHWIHSSGWHVINDGSVGKPRDGDPRARYITLKIEGDKVDVEFIRVEYDI